MVERGSRWARWLAYHVGRSWVARFVNIVIFIVCDGFLSIPWLSELDHPLTNLFEAIIPSSFFVAVEVVRCTQVPARAWMAAVASDSVIMLERTDTRSGCVLCACGSSGDGEPSADDACCSHPGFNQVQAGAWASDRLGRARLLQQVVQVRARPAGARQAGAW